jgi:hypothetical protein
MMTRGPEFPPVARALAELPDDHPLKVQVADMQAAVAVQAVEAASVEDRLADLEARLAALEAGA